MTAARTAERVTAALRDPGAGLLLDLDGTLVDSEPVHRAAFHAYFTARGWTVSDDVVRRFAGRRGHEAFAEIDGPWRGEDPHRLTDGVVAALRSAGAGGVRPVAVDGAAELLAACRTAGLAVAVVTSARRPWVRAVLAALGSEPLPMVTAEDCVRGKPDPEPFRRGLELLGTDPAATVAAEDMPAGVAAARAAGVGTVVGMTTTHDAATLLASGADVVAADLRPLAEAVWGLARG